MTRCYSKDDGTVFVGKRLCDRCGFHATDGNPLLRYDWRGRPDGIWLHAGCEARWWQLESRKVAGDPADIDYPRSGNHPTAEPDGRDYSPTVASVTNSRRAG